MRLRTRVFVTLLSVSTVLVLVMAILFQLGFERGLDRYINERRQSQLSALATDFADYYRNYGDFSGIDLRLLIWADERAASIPETLVLFDAEQFPVYGPELPLEQLLLRPIEVDQRTVGWVALPRGSIHRDALARNFGDSQRATLLRLLLPALLLAGLGTWWLSRHVLRPIEHSVRLADQLSHGDYLARLGEQRQDELGELMQSMNRLAHSLHQASHARERWLADISHELRTPVAVLQSELEALIDGIRDVTPARIADLHQQVLHLRHLLDDLHDLALADAGSLRYRMTRVDMAALVNETCRTMQRRLQERGLTLDLRCPAQGIPWHGDPTRLRQLLGNLLDNSVKYTHAGGQLQVSLTQRADTIELVVADSAPGIDPTHLPHLFKRLYRVDDNSAPHPGGSGLGLALCQRIVSGHHGTIVATASELGGLAISVRFPV